MSRIGQGSSGLAAPTSFKSGLRRPTVPSNNNVPAASQATCVVTKHNESINLKSSNKDQTTTGKDQNNAIIVNKGQSTNNNQPSASMQESRLGKQRQGSGAAERRQTFLARPSVVTSSGATVNNKQPAPTTVNSQKIKQSSQLQSRPLNSSRENHQSLRLQQPPQQQQLSTNSSSVVANTFAQSRKSQVISSTNSKLGLTTNHASSQANSKGASQFGFNRQTKPAPAGGILSGQGGQVKSGSGQQQHSQQIIQQQRSNLTANQQNNTSASNSNHGQGAFGVRHSVALPSTGSASLTAKSSNIVNQSSTLIQTKRQHVQKSSNLPQKLEPSQFINNARKQQPVLSKQSNMNSIQSLQHNTLNNKQHQTSSQIVGGGSRISKISTISKGHNHQNTVLQQQQSKKDQKLAQSPPFRQRTLVDQYNNSGIGASQKQQQRSNVSPKLSGLQKPSSTTTKNTTTISSTVVPAFNVSLQENQTHQLTSDDKKSSFDLQTPQRTNFQPPMPTEIIKNPALLQIIASGEKTTTEQMQELATETESVNLGASKLQRFKGNAALATPQPQKKCVNRQASPVEKIESSASRVNQVGQISLYQRHNKLAEIRQRKTLLMQQQKKLSENKISVDLSTSIMDDQMMMMLNNKSVSEVVTSTSGINNFTNVDNQLLEIKHQLQLQSSGRMQPQPSQMARVEMDFQAVNDDYNAAEQAIAVDLQSDTIEQIIEFKNSPEPVQRNNSTPQEEKVCSIPVMSEPDPCPFERARLIPDEAQDDHSKDLDLLADVEESSEDTRPRVYNQTSQKNNVLDSQAAAAAILDGSLMSQGSHQSIGQDMVEPMDAPIQLESNTDDNSDANVSADGNHDEVKINRIGQTKQLNTMVGFNQGESLDKVTQDQSQSKQIQISKLSRGKKEYDVTPEPEISVTPRDWGTKLDVKKTTAPKREVMVHQNLIQSQIIDRDQHASMIDGQHSQSFVQHEVSRSISFRKNLRQSSKNTTAQLGHSGHSQSFSQQIQNLNLEDKIKNLQQSIQHLPQRVRRPRSRASKNRSQLSVSIGRQDNEIPRQDESTSPKHSHPLNRLGQVRLGGHRLSLPASFGQGKGIVSQEAFSYGAHEILITQEDNDDDELLLKDLGVIDQKLQRTQNINSMRQMIEEAEVEEDTLEEQKQSPFVPKKLHDFRQKQEKQNRTMSNLDFSADMKMNKTSSMKSQQSRLIYKGKQAKSKFSESSASNRSTTKKISGSSMNQSKHDTLPNATPHRSRLETLALPKARKNAEQSFTKNKPSQDGGDKVRHRFLNQSSQSKQQSDQMSNASSSKSRQAVSPQPRKQRLVESKQSSQLLTVRDQTLLTLSSSGKARLNERRHTSPQPVKRIFNYNKQTQQQSMMQTSSFSGQNKIVLLQTEKPKTKRINEIALYKDTQPILSLRKRHFPQAVQQKHLQYPFLNELERNPDEQLIEEIDLIECPHCKRRFESGVFAEIHNQQDLCRRVFIQKRPVFDTLTQRIGWDTDMSRALDQAKQSINHLRRNQLNSNWKQKRELFLKYTQMHKEQIKGKIINKLRMPAIIDPESQDLSQIVGAKANDQEDHSLFMNDISYIEARSYSDVAGTLTTSKMLLQSSYMDFDPVQEIDEESKDGASQVADVRVPCEFCGRKFNPDVSLKHVPICQRNYEKKHGPVRRSTLMPTHKRQSQM